MEGVLTIPLAVLGELHPVGIVLLVLHRGVVAPFADGACEGDDVFHSQNSWAEKEKTLGYLGTVNSIRTGRGPGPAWARTYHFQRSTRRWPPSMATRPAKSA